MQVRRTGVAIFSILLLASRGLVAQDARVIAQKAFPSVVLLVMSDRDGAPKSQGSGFFVRPNVIATNLHVIEGASGGYAKLVGQEAKFNVDGTLATDEEHDLALLSVEVSKSRFMSISPPDRNAEIGEAIFVVGNPFGLEGTFSSGMISGIRQSEFGTLLQITAPISPGSSGGPVLNVAGEVMGVAVSTLKDGQNLNFAIPSVYLTRLLSNIGNVKPLFAAPSQARRKSPASSTGEKKLIEGVVAEKLVWDRPWAPYFSFSLRNHLRVPVVNVLCILSFVRKMVRRWISSYTSILE